jgi:hypothetical protein
MMNLRGSLLYNCGPPPPTSASSGLGMMDVPIPRVKLIIMKTGCKLSTQEWVRYTQLAPESWNDNQGVWVPNNNEIIYSQVLRG